MDNPAPFSDDPQAVQERENCDYSLKITTEMAKNGTAPRKIRVCADGVFDVFHQGHALNIRQARRAFPLCEVYLIVAAHSDKVTHALKGKTLMTEEERYEAIRHCRYVDEVIADAPWEVYEDKFLQEYKIDFIAHDGAPYGFGVTDGSKDLFLPLKAKDMFLPTKRTEGISTSEIISRVLKSQEDFASRNLNRGYTRTELGLKECLVNENEVDKKVFNGEVA